MKHMNDNNLFSTCQYGCINKRNCVLQLLDVSDDWSKYHDESKQIDNIYLDIKKAFDAIPHDRLLLKLKRYGLDGQLLNWVKDF